MRAEVFAKDTQSLVAASRLLLSVGARGINVPNKATVAQNPELAPAAALHSLAAALAKTEMEGICPHYSLKFNNDARDPASTLRRFEAFCEEAASLHVREILLVSGSGSRSFDSLACLKALTLPAERRPAIGVAFNPFFPDRAARMRERARLRQKLNTGAVSAIWLQIGSDVLLLREALAFLAELQGVHPALRLYGSVFLPSRKLLAQLKFRPWNGVFLSAEYLSSVEVASTITCRVLDAYATHGVEPLLESAVRSRAEWRAAREQLGLSPDIPAALSTAEDPVADATEATEPGLSEPPLSKRPRRQSNPVAPVDAEPAAAVSPATSAGASGAAAPTACSLVWFRTFDIRLADHAPLRAAASAGAVCPCFVWPARRGTWSLGGAAQAWLREALRSLAGGLREHYSSRLVLRAPSGGGDASDEYLAAAAAASSKVAVPRGADCAAAEAEAVTTAAELLRLADESSARAVYWHRSYEPEGQRVEAVVREALRGRGIACVAMAGALLYEPAAVHCPAGWQGGHWGTLMPFLRACERSGPPPTRPTERPVAMQPPCAWPASGALEDLRLAAPPVLSGGSVGRDWSAAMMAGWEVSEAAAARAMADFVGGGGLAGYEARRSRADEPSAVSRLSAFLRFGQLSPRALHFAVRDAGLPREQVKTFARRLHWRDLASFHLSVFPEMPWRPIRAHYASHEWSGDASALRAWQRGNTGFPMVDAGMRCLYATGWMHQSVRMVVASFLIEYLGISWVDGARWFHDTLVDADLAINSMMWQNAGRSGIDQCATAHRPSILCM